MQNHSFLQPSFANKLASQVPPSPPDGAINVPHMKSEGVGMLQHLHGSGPEPGPGGKVRCKTGRPRQREGLGKLENRVAVRETVVLVV